ncbi:hypothetical protein CR513_36458, partial [Mucuna pruriens]
MLKAKLMHREFWVKAIATNVYILNKCPTKCLKIEDYVTGNDIDPSDEEIINFALFVDYELMAFEEALSDENWRKDMDDEIHVVVKNAT